MLCRTLARRKGPRHPILLIVLTVLLRCRMRLSVRISIWRPGLTSTLENNFFSSFSANISASFFFFLSIYPFCTISSNLSYITKTSPPWPTQAIKCDFEEVYLLLFYLFLVEFERRILSPSQFLPSSQ